MRISQSLLLLAGFAAFVACDEGVSNSDSGEVLNMPTVQDSDELGACNDSTIASIVYVADSAKVFFCDGRDWRDLNGVDGKDGEDGRDGKDGKDGIDGVDGYSGNSCSAVLDSNLVYTIVCGRDSIEIDLKIRTPSTCSVNVDEDSTVVLVCGADSAVVRVGEMGPAAESCTVTDHGDGTYTRKCGDSEVLYYKGLCGDTPYDPEIYTCEGITLVKRGE